MAQRIRSPHKRYENIPTAQITEFKDAPTLSVSLSHQLLIEKSKSLSN